MKIEERKNIAKPIKFAMFFWEKITFSHKKMIKIRLKNDMILEL